MTDQTDPPSSIDMDEIEEQWRRMGEASRIWDDPQFLLPEVCKITGATAKALEHFVNPKRGLVRLIGSHVNPGTGRRRMFTGAQVLMIKAAYTMNRIGFPQRWSIVLSDLAERRARNRHIGLATPNHMVIASYPNHDGTDWAFTPIFDGNDPDVKLPLAVQLLDVDRLIEETREQLQAIIDGQDIPDFSTPEPPQEPNPYSPKSNFFHIWAKSPEGEWLLVGLDKADTADLLAHMGWKIVSDEIEIVEPINPDPFDLDEMDRLLGLREKHEEARLKIIGHENAERQSRANSD